MSIVVEHEKRRREILEKALDVFMDEGFENATFQKIAARCGITRTTLYIYFKNKKDIFNYSIKQLLGEVERRIGIIRKDKERGSAEKITGVMAIILEQLEKNRRLLTVILNYLLYLSKSGSGPGDRVRRRTLRLRHILATMIIEGNRSGDLAPVDIRTVDDLLYGIIESAIFRLTVLEHDSVGELLEAAELAVKRLQMRDAGLEPTTFSSGG